MPRPKACVVYVGDLPSDIRTREVEDVFYKFGRILNIDIKGGERGRAFAFVEFDHPRDAHDAVRERDGTKVFGERIRVEIAKGTSGPPPAPRDWRDKGTGFRIIVDGLPKHASWQDLKDMFRKVETPVYTNVYQDSKGIFGVVEYNTHEELLDVIRDMKGAEFKNPFCEPTPVTLIDDTDSDRKTGTDERNRSEDRSPPRESRRSRSRSRSRSRCGALQGSGAVLWACLHMADASFATVVSHLLVWSSDGSALAGDTRGVSTRGLQHCGQGIWGVSCSTRVFVLNCFPRLQQLICPCMGTDAFSQFLPMLKHAHGLILLAGHPDDHSRKVAQYKAIVGQDQQCCRALPCLCCADPLCNRGSHWCFPDALYILHRYRSNKLGNYLSTKLLCYNVA